LLSDLLCPHHLRAAAAAPLISRIAASGPS
jgi:hypothetical protein